MMLQFTMLIFKPKLSKCRNKSDLYRLIKSIFLLYNYLRRYSVLLKYKYDTLTNLKNKNHKQYKNYKEIVWQTKEKRKNFKIMKK